MSQWIREDLQRQETMLCSLHFGRNWTSRFPPIIFLRFIKVTEIAWVKVSLSLPGCGKIEMKLMVLKNTTGQLGIVVHVIIPALGRPRQEGHDFEACLGCRVRPCLKRKIPLERHCGKNPMEAHPGFLLSG
jgi:hypothetical protein